jgi:hypothetical protein
MKISRAIYAILTVALVWLYFQPWTVVSGQNFPGWSTVFLSFFYFVGLAMTIIVLFTGYRAVGLSIFAGILMVGNNLVSGIIFGLVAVANHSQFGWGFTYVFFLSLIFLILGPICGSGFDKTKHVKISGDSLWKVVGIGLIVAILGGLILKYVFKIG